MAASGFMPCDAPNGGGWMLIEADDANVAVRGMAPEQARVPKSVTDDCVHRNSGTAPGLPPRRRATW